MEKLKAYSEIKLQVTKSKYGEIQWYEYLVMDSDDFEFLIKSYLLHQRNNRLHSARVEAINQALNILNNQKHHVTRNATTKDWVAAYWVLYLNGLIKMGYNKTHPTGIMIFAAPTHTLTFSHH